MLADGVQALGGKLTPVVTGYIAHQAVAFAQIDKIADSLTQQQKTVAVQKVGDLGSLDGYISDPLPPLPVRAVHIVFTHADKQGSYALLEKKIHLLLIAVEFGGDFGIIAAFPVAKFQYFHAIGDGIDGLLAEDPVQHLKFLGAFVADVFSPVAKIGAVVVTGAAVDRIPVGMNDDFLSAVSLYLQIGREVHGVGQGNGVFSVLFNTGTGNPVSEEQQRHRTGNKLSPGGITVGTDYQTFCGLLHRGTEGEGMDIGIIGGMAAAVKPAFLKVGDVIGVIHITQGFGP